MTTNLKCKVKPPGRVILAGAGPGDPELITLKLARALAQADVIIADRLVHPRIIDRHASPQAEIIIAGKQGYHSASARQDDINELLVEKALPGKLVLRLKGGDVAIFSNVWDEILALKKANIPYEIIPGITAASGASAYAGIPLTARHLASGVRFLTVSESSPLSHAAWEELAHTTDTLVFYMCVAHMEQIISQLSHFSLTDKPLLCIEQATTIHQKVSLGRLKQNISDWLPPIISTPALLIVGEVGQLHHTYRWLRSEETPGSVFTSCNTI